MAAKHLGMAGKFAQNGDECLIHLVSCAFEKSPTATEEQGVTWNLYHLYALVITKCYYPYCSCFSVKPFSETIKKIQFIKHSLYTLTICDNMLSTLPVKTAGSVLSWGVVTK